MDKVQPYRKKYKTDNNIMSLLGIFLCCSSFNITRSVFDIHYNLFIELSDGRVFILMEARLMSLFSSEEEYELIEK